MFRFTRHVLMYSSVAFALASCGSSTWHSSILVDEFTDATLCRVESSSAFERSFARQVTYTPFAYYFYAEKHSGMPRIGIRSEPQIPILGDVQIRVDDNAAWTITVQETPLDLATKPPQPYPQIDGLDGASIQSLNDAITTATENAQKYASPYRVATGEKAQAILTQVASGNEVKFRLVGVNAAASFTGSFRVDDSFKEAAQDCGLI